MALSKEDIFMTGPSPEEEKYNTAVELMDAIDCVERFERAVTSLRSAAAMFEELGDYEDARKRRKQCADKADQIEREGCEKTLQTAKDMYDKAKTKSDLIKIVCGYCENWASENYDSSAVVTLMEKIKQKQETKLAMRGFARLKRARCISVALLHWQ